MKFYRVNYGSSLEEISKDEILAGEYAIDSFGRLVKAVHVDGDGYIVIEKDSPLNDGELVEDLTPLQLDLFWKLCGFGEVVKTG